MPRTPAFLDVMSKLFREIGPDPSVSLPKFELLCSGGLDPWLYVCRSLACYEKSSQHDALEWISQEYPGLAPFDLRPIEAELQLENGYDPCGGARGMFAILNLNLPSEQFVPPVYVEGEDWGCYLKSVSHHTVPIHCLAGTIAASLLF
eukprot:Protomagalhaensia_sp_Gyna_25__1393@NODE_1701_length_1607_cov_2_563138_g1394_i0_p2_GENE_NODE_1701_length_1607_cov_2_563138_g1394_i0NODE_1701_length_1607_cov_2_563138_g1394_i0_p2_ORF_typecomplete_len148_score7_34_NODE_1701_length_1607_cov_2_563138_g1394_i011431586